MAGDRWPASLTHRQPITGNRQPIMQLHGWEAALFYVLAIMTLFMAVFVVTARVAVHSALFLISTLVNVALLFILLRAEFVAGVQILVYVGGVMSCSCL